MNAPTLPVRTPDEKLQSIIKIATLAVGGQGGGVLTGWIESVARAQGYAAQATSVAGVAQRTGATIYYIEMAPMGDTMPVFSLAPTSVAVGQPTPIALGGAAIAEGDTVVFIPFGTVMSSDGALAYEPLTPDCAGAMAYAVSGTHGGVVTGGTIAVTLPHLGLYKMCTSTRDAPNPAFQ